MLKISPQAFNEIAVENGWVHDRGRLKGTVNASAMAGALGVSTSTITRAYDNGATGLGLIEKLMEVSDRSLDDLMVKVAA